MTNLSSELYTAFAPDLASVRAFMHWLVRANGLPVFPKVLDIGCGPGQMLAEYASLGWPVVGLEPDADFYAAAAERFEGGDLIEVRPGGFNEITAVSEFDLVTAINGPFAYLLQREQQADALCRVWRALKPGGLLFIDIPNILWFLKHQLPPPPQTKVVAGQLVRLVKHYNYDLHQALFIPTNEYHTKNGQGAWDRRCKQHYHAIISYPELAYLAGQHGFSAVQTFPNYQARMCGQLGERIMIAARKG